MRVSIGKSIGALGAAGAAIALGAVAVVASGGYTLFGDATLVHPGHNSPTAVQLESSPSIAPAYGGIDFAVPAGLTFADVQILSTDYMFTAGSCGAGAPRFSINVDGVNAFVYIGPPPNYTACPLGVWSSTGNLAAAASFIETSQLPGGTFYDTFTAARARYSSLAVTGIQLVTDSGGTATGGVDQVVQIDNVQINDVTYTFESAKSCKKGGWEDFTSAPGPFNNQGDCVSWFATGGRNG